MVRRGRKGLKPPRRAVLPAPIDDPFASFYKAIRRLRTALEGLRFKTAHWSLQANGLIMTARRTANISDGEPGRRNNAGEASRIIRSKWHFPAKVTIRYSDSVDFWAV